MYTFKYVEREILVEAFVSAVNAVRPRGFVFNGELHDFWEMVFVKSGKAVATAEEQVFNLSSGQLLFHKPMEFHRIKSADGSAPHLIIISFKASGIRMKDFARCCLNISEKDQERLETVSDRISQIVRRFNSDETHSLDYHFLLNKTAVMLESLLLDLSKNINSIRNSPSGDERRFSTIVKTMQEHCCDNLSVPEIAALCSMSISNMKRVFALYSDRGIAKYFLSLKIRYAMELLGDGVSVSEVADKLGFSSACYFSTVFSRETGTSPGQYRKSHCKLK